MSRFMQTPMSRVVRLQRLDERHGRATRQRVHRRAVKRRWETRWTVAGIWLREKLDHDSLFDLFNACDRETKATNVYPRGSCSRFVRESVVRY